MVVLQLFLFLRWCKQKLLSHLQSVLMCVISQENRHLKGLILKHHLDGNYLLL